MSTAGQVLAVGENGMAQLGLKSAISQRQNPQPIPLPDQVVQIAAGPLHSVCLTVKNQIFTFGCNDEHALGRADPENDDDDEADQFGQVDMSAVIKSDQEKIIQIVAGDSHTIVLSDAGKVYGKMHSYLVDSFKDDFFRLGNISIEYNRCLWFSSKRCYGKNTC